MTDARGFWSRLPRQRRILFGIAGLLALVVIAITAVSVIGGASPFAGGPSVATSALQSDITHRLSATGDTPDAVTCAEDLPGEVAKTAQCEVQNKFVGNFEVVATVTRVDGSKVSYDLAPSFTKEQLEQQVQIQNGQTFLGVGGPIQSVSCDSGLQGTAGAATRCEYSRDGTHYLTVKMLRVDGLNMQFQLITDPS